MLGSLYTPKEVANMLRVSIRTLEVWRKKRLRLEFYKINGRILYNKDEIDRFLLDHKKKVKPKPYL